VAKRKGTSTRSTSSRRTAGRSASTKKTATRGKAATRKIARGIRAAASKTTGGTRRSGRAPGRLTQKEIEEFRATLLKKRAELVGDVAALNEAGQNSAGNLSSLPQHMADIGSDNYEQEFALTLMEGERALLREIDEALQRIENGTFGICAATGKPIGKARLKATPWAKYCYEYVLEQEQRGHRRF